MVILYAEFNKIMLKNGTSDNFNEAKRIVFSPEFFRKERATSI